MNAQRNGAKTGGTPFDYHGEISWCPGCGDYKILECLKAALTELGLDPTGVAVVSGIGQAAKMPHYLTAHFFNGLHGRALPAATGVRAANPNLTVIAVGGDGDMYGEGGNHFIHTARRNPNIAHIVCNNMIYGLTKGQASPTSPLGMRTATQPEGVNSVPLNPLALALACGASFVARGFAGAPDLTKEIIKKAILHKGYALVDIFQPCVSFNKLNTWQWFAANTVELDRNRDASDLAEANRLAFQSEPWPLGVLYEGPGRPTFKEGLAPWRSGDGTPLFGREAPTAAVREFLKAMQG